MGPEKRNNAKLQLVCGIFQSSSQTNRRTGSRSYGEIYMLMRPVALGTGIFVAFPIAAASRLVSPEARHFQNRKLLVMKTLLSLSGLPIPALNSLHANKVVNYSKGEFG